MPQKMEAGLNQKVFKRRTTRTKTQFINVTMEEIMAYKMPSDNKVDDMRVEAFKASKSSIDVAVGENNLKCENTMIQVKSLENKIKEIEPVLSEELRTFKFSHLLDWIKKDKGEEKRYRVDIDRSIIPPIKCNPFIVADRSTPI